VSVLDTAKQLIQKEQNLESVAQAEYYQEEEDN
jgi:hypothetical protein